MTNRHFLHFAAEDRILTTVGTIRDSQLLNRSVPRFRAFKRRQDLAKAGELLVQTDKPIDKSNDRKTKAATEWLKRSLPENGY
jgi:hypothetical protein